MTAPLYDSSLIEYEDFVGIPDGAQTVRDDQARATPSPKALIDEMLGQRIERARSLIENHQRRIAHQTAGDLQALPLPPAEIDSALRHRSIVTFRAGDNIGMDARIARRPLDGRIGQCRVP